MVLLSIVELRPDVLGVSRGEAGHERGAKGETKHVARRIAVGGGSTVDEVARERKESQGEASVAPKQPARGRVQGQAGPRRVGQVQGPARREGAR